MLDVALHEGVVLGPHRAVLALLVPGQRAGVGAEDQPVLRRRRDGGLAWPQGRELAPAGATVLLGEPAERFEHLLRGEMAEMLAAGGDDVHVAGRGDPPHATGAEELGLGALAAAGLRRDGAGDEVLTDQRDVVVRPVVGRPAQAGGGSAPGGGGAL